MQIINNQVSIVKVDVFMTIFILQYYSMSPKFYLNYCLSQ